MMQAASSALRAYLSPSLRFELRRALSWLRELGGRASVWRWEIVQLRAHDAESCAIAYAGRKSQRALACALLGLEQGADTGKASLSMPGERTALVSEVPLPGALCVPWYVSAVVPLDRTLEEITARYSRELLRKLRKQRSRYRVRQVLDDAGVARVERDMLQPYASARHGAAAAQLVSREVRDMAQKYGRLELLLRDDEEVGCQLGCGITRAGKRYWSTNRFGYLPAIFADDRELREVNSFNTHLALEYAIANGFDYYDIGICLARPDDGLLEWKRRRGGEVDTLGNQGCFYVRLPAAGSAQLLWQAPLFAIERGRLTLHLGLPQGQNDDAVAVRYREIGFGGLSRVYLHCARTPAKALLECLRSYFVHQKNLPEFIIY